MNINKTVEKIKEFNKIIESINFKSSDSKEIRIAKP